jgi:predicted nucleotidyltransferase component of viral defense system
VKTATQIKDKIKNLAKEKQIDPLILSKNYMMERFLERIALSRFCDHFILKGGFLIASVVGIDSRSTVDIDTTLKNYPLNSKVLEEIMLEILAIDCDDHISMALKKLETIHEEGDYTGMRVYIETTIDRMRIPIKVDITTGDAITPKEIMYSYPLMFEARSISIWAYNLETVLAEKYHGLLSFGTYNTRMRDYYDIHILLHATMHPIDPDILANAIYQTAKQRQGEHLLARQNVTLKEIFESAEMKALWQAYQKKNPYANEFAWEDVCQSVEKVMLIGIRRDKKTINNNTDEEKNT